MVRLGQVRNTISGPSAAARTDQGPGAAATKSYFDQVHLFYEGEGEGGSKNHSLGIYLCLGSRPLFVKAESLVDVSLAAEGRHLQAHKVGFRRQLIFQCQVSWFGLNLYFLSDLKYFRLKFIFFIRKVRYLQTKFLVISFRFYLNFFFVFQIEPLTNLINKNDL